MHNVAADGERSFVCNQHEDRNERPRATDSARAICHHEDTDENEVRSMERNDEPRLAVLIDADNTTPKWAEAIFEEIATLGEASVRRIYGDFS